MKPSYAVVGGGVVGCAVAMELARRGRDVTLFEAQSELGLSASGTNSGILHTGFDSKPGELETALILRAVPLRDEAIVVLGIPVSRCGARMRHAPSSASENARQNGVEVRWDGADLVIPGESVTDPVTMTKAYAARAERAGARLELGRRVSDDLRGYAVVINCAGLYADAVARQFGDDSFTIRPRKGEFLVFPNPGLDEILLPVPTPRTKGILVFPTLDGHVCCGPTAEDGDDKEDWSVRDVAREMLIHQASAVMPELGTEPMFAYAGLRPAGANGENYVISWSGHSERLLNVAAIRSTGLTAALGIADYVCVDLLGLEMRPAPFGPPAESRAGSSPWWARTATLRELA
jgi:glycerol-3-phosphate dehydrogenase